MGSIALIGGSIVVLMALTTDSKGTISAITVVITVRGITFICKKITSAMNKDFSEILDFTGWSLAGISIIQIIKFATNSVFFQSILKTNESLTNLASSLDRFANFLDRITIWN